MLCFCSLQKRLVGFDEDLFYVFVLTISLLNLRYTSFCLDWISAKKQRALDAAAAANQPDVPKEVTSQGSGEGDPSALTSKPAEDIPTIQEPPVEKETETRKRVNVPQVVKKDLEQKKEDKDEEKDQTEDDKPEKEGDKQSEAAESEKSEGSEEKGGAGDGVEQSAAGQEEQEPEPEIVVQYSLLDMLSYCLYLPYYVTGPLTTYDEFYKQVGSVSSLCLRNLL